MGTYLYGLRKHPTIKANYQGKTITIFPFIYEMKPSFCFNERLEKMENLIRGRLRRVWENSEIPEFVGIADEDGFCEGQSIYRLLQGKVMWYDSSPFPGESCIGFLKKNRKKWDIAQTFDDEPIKTGPIDSPNLVYRQWFIKDGQPWCKDIKTVPWEETIMI